MKTIKVLGFSLILSFYFSACMTARVDSHSVIGPDGTENEIIYCTNMGMEACYGKANQVCGGTYKIVNSNETNQYLGQGQSVETSQILVKCDSGGAVMHFGKKPPAPIASGANDDPYAKATSFADCDQYESLEKDRCREDVYQRQQSAKSAH